MGTKMNSEAYKKLIDEDIEWLNKQPKTLEREHIKHVVEESINFYYPHLVENLTIHDVTHRLLPELWKYTENELPLAYRSGNWDGKNSEEVLAEDCDGKKYIATYNEGYLDGTNFKDWYDSGDFLIEKTVVRWLKIPE